MIAVIIGIPLILLSIILVAFGFVLDKEKPFFAGLTIFIVVCVVLTISLTSGKSIYKKDNTKLIMEKEQIEYLLENNISFYVIEQAREYNREIDRGNNLWCRFSIENRDDYKIDIDNYLNKESENDK